MVTILVAISYAPVYWDRYQQDVLIKRLLDKNDAWQRWLGEEAPAKHEVVLVNVDFSGKDFSEKDLSHRDLRFINFKNTCFNNANCQSSGSSSANLSYSKFKGARLNFAEFNNADLTGSDLTGAVFHRADLSGANLDSVHGWETANFKEADISNLKNPPMGLIEYAKKQGAYDKNDW